MESRTTGKDLGLRIWAGCRRKVTVFEVPPGMPDPGEDKCDYYVSMVHDREHWTFADSFADEPISKAKYAAIPGKCKRARPRCAPPFVC